MDKRYQIFISSTYTDLKEERDKVMRAVLDLNYFPAGMEQFPAVGIPPIELIRKILKDCDYYILIIGARYGSIGKNGKSFTEEEYDYAVQQGIPVIAFLHADPKSISIEKSDENDELRKKLKLFREKVEQGGQTVKYWKNPDDLSSKVLSSIPKAIQYQERPGWVRADAISGGNSKDVDTLQEKIRILESELEKTKSSLDALRGSNLKESASTLSEIRSFSVNHVTFRMIHIEGGTFIMGAEDQDSEALDDEKPRHQVTLSDYWIGETLVTQALWQAVMEGNPSHFTGDLNCPVDSISWFECKEFISKLNKLTGEEFHLPTEAQWEYAARGGNKSNNYKYAGSDDIDDVAWYDENSKHKTHPVAELNCNELGLYDMSGNIWEWCQDWYGNYHNDEQTNPKGPRNGTQRVMRGGGWNYIAEHCRVSIRNFIVPSNTVNIIGLRLALSSSIK